VLGTVNPKARALRLAANSFRGDVLVFFDADVVICDPRGLLEAVVLVANDPRPLLMSIQPFHEAEGFIESLALYPNVISLMASGGFTPSNRLGISTVAFGPALILRRSTYEAIGGHGAAEDSILDDVALARAVRSLPEGQVRLRAGRSGLSFRMYPEGFASLIEGFGKNIAGGSSAAPLYLSVGAGLWFAGGLAATVGLVAFHATLTERMVALVEYVVVASLQFYEARQVGRFSWALWVLLPVAQITFVGIFLLSIIRKVALGSVSWRGQSIKLRR
jgi:4,4'-diaponeurosporenoate glycosyltransferase